MHATLKRVGTVFRTDIQNLERVRVSVWLGVLSLHIEESGGEIVRINFGRLAEIRERAERNMSRARRVLPNLRPLTRTEESRCGRARAIRSCDSLSRTRSHRRLSAESGRP